MSFCEFYVFFVFLNLKKLKLYELLILNCVKVGASQIWISKSDLNNFIFHHSSNIQSLLFGAYPSAIEIFCNNS